MESKPTTSYVTLGKTALGTSASSPVRWSLACACAQGLCLRSLGLCVDGCLRHWACVGLARVASAFSSGAMKVAMLCHLADQEQAPSSVRGVVKARQIKAGVRNDTFLDKASTALN